MEVGRKIGGFCRKERRVVIQSRKLRGMREWARKKLVGPGAEGNRGLGWCLIGVEKDVGDWDCFAIFSALLLQPGFRVTRLPESAPSVPAKH